MDGKPIIFSTWKAQRIRQWDWSDGPMQTRRVIRTVDGSDHFVRMEGDRAVFTDHILDLANSSESHLFRTRCLYGKPGDQLWVREAWNLLVEFTVSWGENDYDFDREEADFIPQVKPFNGTVCYRAVDSDVCKWWRPSIHMPHWASEINLVITGLRVERLQSISQSDARAEGVDPWIPDNHQLSRYVDPGGSFRNGFHRLWDVLNAKRGFSWDKNPWVWVITFKRIFDANLSSSPKF